MKSNLNYSFGELFSRGSNWLILFSLPFFTSPELFGKLALVILSSYLLSSLILLGQNKIVLRYSEEKSLYKSVYSIVFSVFLTIVMLFLFANFLLEYNYDIIGIDNDTKSVICFFFISFYLSLRQIRLSSLIVENKSREYLITQVLFGISKLILIPYVVYKYQSVDSYLVLVTIISSFFMLYEFKSVKKAKIFNRIIDSSRIKKYLFIGAPLILNIIVGNVLSYVDRYFLKYFYTFEQVGEYTFANNFSSITAFLFAPLVIIFEIKIYKEKTAFNREQLINKFINTTLFLTCLVSLVIYALLNPISSFFDNQYQHSVEIVFILLSGTVLNTYYLCANFRLVSQENTHLIPVFTFIPGLVNIILNYIFIPKYGIVAAAYTTFFCYLLQAIIINAFSIKRENHQKKDFVKSYLLPLVILSISVINSTFFVISYLTLILLFSTSLKNYHYIWKKFD